MPFSQPLSSLVSGPIDTSPAQNIVNGGQNLFKGSNNSKVPPSAGLFINGPFKKGLKQVTQHQFKAYACFAGYFELLFRSNYALRAWLFLLATLVVMGGRIAIRLLRSRIAILPRIPTKLRYSSLGTLAQGLYCRSNASHCGQSFALLRKSKLLRDILYRTGASPWAILRIAAQYPPSSDSCAEYCIAQHLRCWAILRIAPPHTSLRSVFVLPPRSVSRFAPNLPSSCSSFLEASLLVRGEYSPKGCIRSPEPVSGNEGAKEDWAGC